MPQSRSIRSRFCNNGFETRPPRAVGARTIQLRCAWCSSRGQAKGQRCDRRRALEDPGPDKQPIAGDRPSTRRKPHRTAPSASGRTEERPCRSWRRTTCSRRRWSFQRSRIDRSLLFRTMNAVTLACSTTTVPPAAGASRRRAWDGRRPAGRPASGTAAPPSASWGPKARRSRRCRGRAWPAASAGR